MLLRLRVRWCTIAANEGGRGGCERMKSFRGLKIVFVLVFMHSDLWVLGIASIAGTFCCFIDYRGPTDHPFLRY